MRPTPIPDHEIWDGAVRRVIGPPGGDLESGIDPVEALVDISPSQGGRRLSVRCVLEDGDLEVLAGGGTVWLTFWGAMVPWGTTVMAAHPAPGEAAPAPAVDEQLVERVAARMCLLAMQAHWGDGYGAAWDECEPATQEIYRAEARAAIGGAS